MVQNSQNKRFHFSLIARRTQKVLVFLLTGFSIALFVLHLLLMNQLSMRGYILSQATNMHHKLAQKNEHLEAEISRLQTQEYIKKIALKESLMVEKKSNYVFLSANFTAQK